MKKPRVAKKMFKTGKLATEKELKAVDMPIGLDIEAEGPNEIAISIMAKIISIDSLLNKFLSFMLL